MPNTTFITRHVETCKVAHGGKPSDSFEVKTGFGQRCLLSPFLSLLAIDWIMKTTMEGRNNGIQWSLWKQLDDLNFADDLVLLSHRQQQMQEKATQEGNAQMSHKKL